VGSSVILVLGIALVMAMVAMLVSDTGKGITLATTKFDQVADEHHH